MKQITGSATRLVLVLMIFTLCITTTYIVIANSQKDIVLTTVLGIFSNVAIAIVAFYFGKSSSNSGNEGSSRETITKTETQSVSQ